MPAASNVSDDELVFTCAWCEADYLPTAGECPECGDWAFTASLGPAPVGLASRAIGGA